ncbi:probable ribonuclease 11 precursor [Rattus norvegicus]|nr:probable ribonuclease 11 precursor [Rattus norvegicus]AAI28715.1 Ribonuclease, RNase A family, 11 (non-active) [Rattus norvegicus]AAV87200.1 ribonuclease 11 [Rattus norvegicus]CDG32042.1 TPA: ribonuclease A j1 [Rattus norvegicus]|eukprot:NP_001012494.1 probable ribonuclease 11 precursor [Rattus norvegicus]
MAAFLLLLVLGLLLVEPSESKTKGAREQFSQEETRSAAKQTPEESTNSTLSDENISLGISRHVMSAPPRTSRRLSFVIPKRNTVRNGRDCVNSPSVWRTDVEVNESCQLGNNFIHSSMDVSHGIPKATSGKCERTPNLRYCDSLGLECTMCKVLAGHQCPRYHEHRITSLKRILTVLTSHSLMSWLVTGC